MVFQPGQSGTPENVWKKGQSGNPKGKMPSITRVIREYLKKKTVNGKPLPDGKTIEDALGEMFVREALKGKFAFAKELIDRIDGKVPDRVLMGEDQNVPVKVIRGVSMDDLLPKADATESESAPEAEA